MHYGIFFIAGGRNYSKGSQRQRLSLSQQGAWDSSHATLERVMVAGIHVRARPPFLIATNNLKTGAGQEMCLEGWYFRGLVYYIIPSGGSKLLLAPLWNRHGHHVDSRGRHILYLYCTALVKQMKAVLGRRMPELLGRNTDACCTNRKCRHAARPSQAYLRAPYPPLLLTPFTFVGAQRTPKARKCRKLPFESCTGFTRTIV